MRSASRPTSSFRFRATLLAAVASYAVLATASCGSDTPSATPDAGSPSPPDAQATPDVGTADTGNAADAAPDAARVCVAGAWAPPRKNAKCTSSEIADMLAACLGQGPSSAVCTDFQTRHAACAGCLYQNVATGDTTRGPWLGLPQTDSKLIDVNVAGCIALVEGVPGDTGCGATAWAASVCLYQACCGALTVDAFQTCAGKASSAGGACAPAVMARDACASVIHGTESCFVGGGLASDHFQRVGELFCGGRVDGDAGADAGSDGSADTGTDASAGDASDASSDAGPG